jgi:gamma-glutamylcyclotransferase (GGCT)/AIG2-like uncharacterized protein YtfP
MPSQEPIYLFVYGTLMDPQCVEALTGGTIHRVDATLVGFERLASDLGYPYISPKLGAVVHGILLTDLDPGSLHALDSYEAEGDLYVRQVVNVCVGDTSVRAMTYVGHRIRGTAEHVLTGTPHG